MSLKTQNFRDFYCCCCSYSYFPRLLGLTLLPAVPWALDLRTSQCEKEDRLCRTQCSARLASLRPRESRSGPETPQVSRTTPFHAAWAYSIPRASLCLPQALAPSCLIFSLGQVHVILTKDVFVKASMRKPTECGLYFSQGLNWLLISFKCGKEETTLRQLWKLSLPSTIEFSFVIFKKKEKKNKHSGKKVVFVLP